MRRALLAVALAGSAAFVAAPASAINCPPGTKPTPLPTGHNVCVPYVHCDPGACIDQPLVQCPYDVPVWSGVCRQVFGG